MMEYYSARKRENLLIHVATQTALKSITLSEVIIDKTVYSVEPQSCEVLVQKELLLIEKSEQYLPPADKGRTTGKGFEGAL